MPRKAKQVSQSEVPAVVETPTVEPINEAQPTLTKDDYNKARHVIKQYRASQKSKPKRPCTQKQLEALAQGRLKNKRFANKSTGTKE